MQLQIKAIKMTKQFAPYILQHKHNLRKQNNPHNGQGNKMCNPNVNVLVSMFHKIMHKCGSLILFIHQTVYIVLKQAYHQITNTIYELHLIKEH